jgi:hypothetical protein
LIALDLDTLKNTNFAWHLWIITTSLITWEAEIGKIVLEGSLGKEVTLIFKISRAKWTNVTLGLEAPSHDFKPKSHNPKQVKN